MDAASFLVADNHLSSDNKRIIPKHGSTVQSSSNSPVYSNDIEQPIGFVTVLNNGDKENNLQISSESLNSGLENSVLPGSGLEKRSEFTLINYENEDLEPQAGLVPTRSGVTFRVIPEYSNIVSSGNVTCSGRSDGKELGSRRVMVMQASQPEGSCELPFVGNKFENLCHLSSSSINSGMPHSLAKLDGSSKDTILSNNGQKECLEFTPRGNEREDVKPCVGLVSASAGDTLRVIPEHSNSVSSVNETCIERDIDEGCNGYEATQAPQPGGSYELALLSSSLDSDMLCSSQNVHPDLENGNLSINVCDENYEFTPRNCEIEDVKPPVGLELAYSILETDCSILPGGDKRSSEIEFTNYQNEEIIPSGFSAPEPVSESSDVPSSADTMSCNNIEEIEISVYFDPECSRSAEFFRAVPSYSSDVSSEKRTCSGRNTVEETESYRVSVAQVSQPETSPELPRNENGYYNDNQVSPGLLNSGIQISSSISREHNPSGNDFQHQSLSDTVNNLMSSTSSGSVSEDRNVCPYCQKWFRSDNLNRHILVIHSTCRPFKCQICPKEFAAEVDLNKHAERHKKLTCPYCTDVFHIRRSLLKHAVLQHKDEDLTSLPLWAFRRNALPCSNPGCFSCSSCLVEFDSLRACLDHWVRSHFLKECWVCQRLFKKGTALKRHIKTHTGERLFPCDHCDRSFFTDSERRLHLRRLTLEKSVKCSVCDRGFKTKAQRDRHTLTHDNEKPFQCTVCAKAFKSERTFKIHIRVHTGEMPFECQYCDQSFRSWRTRQNHQKKDHPNLVDKKVYICSYCSKSYTNSNSFNNHVKRHTGQALRCELCSFVTVSKENLEIHINKHTGAKPYKCRYCPMAYGQPNRLQIHERTHTGEKPYSCDQCDKAFVDKYSLVRHVRTHTGEKPYKCSHCGKGFAQGCQLQFHERTHTGEKPYECSQCEKKFKRRQELNRHMETHEERQQGGKNKRKVHEKTYECTCCVKTFSCQQDLKKHLEAHDKEGRVTKRKRKRKNAESDSKSEFGEEEVNDLGQDREERLSSLRSAQKSTGQGQ